MPSRMACRILIQMQKEMVLSMPLMTGNKANLNAMSTFIITFKSTSVFKFFTKLFSDENLTKKAYMNVLAATLDYGVRLITGFLVTPFLVSGLGDILYGVWRTLGNLTGYISAASGRPSQALKFTIAS